MRPRHWRGSGRRSHELCRLLRRPMQHGQRTAVPVGSAAILLDERQHDLPAVLRAAQQLVMSAHLVWHACTNRPPTGRGLTSGPRKRMRESLLFRARHIRHEVIQDRAPSLPKYPHIVPSAGAFHGVD